MDSGRESEASGCKATEQSRITRDIELHALDPQVAVLETYVVLSLLGDWGLKPVSTSHLSPQVLHTCQQRA